MPRGIPGWKHGTPTGYQKGCRRDDDCPASPSCRQARNADVAERAARKPKTATRKSSKAKMPKYNQAGAPQYGTPPEQRQAAMLAELLDPPWWIRPTPDQELSAANKAN